MDTVPETVGTLTDVVDRTTGVAAQAAGGASRETEAAQNRERDQDDRVAGATPRAESPVREDARDLTGAGPLSYAGRTVCPVRDLRPVWREDRPGQRSVRR